MKVEVDWGLCDGNGMCAVEAPEHFEIDDDDELVVLREDVAEGEVATVERAVTACPKHALSLSDDG